MKTLKLVKAVALAVGISALISGGAAAELAKPTGAVILTIGGAVKYNNQPPFNKFNDAFLHTQEYSFEKAAAFDRAMLEKLGTVTTTIKAEPWPRAVTLEGPRLIDVLMAAGWTGSKITTVSMDGFAVEITAADLAARDWILAIKSDGVPLGIGGHGPVWIAYSVPGGTGSAEDESRWPWAVFYISAE
ncbi:MAG: hypothetical protein HOL07_11300 [Rhodospirillaceae bacterium]|nr:hypothetical protein [Rhodospirillaceae bacterium]MBT3810221.1 hypothetical protein [Rhodospirillaceae bacterium]MBT3930686.1 hypothetical protein [Rhodospirillaceae bacterium]MBT4772485.1 hypothetical protein [Rhodospirillaceae bacterium]MBT5358921.1 hypothetical protein [Rhodospirillaceae bacterium]